VTVVVRHGVGEWRKFRRQRVWIRRRWALKRQVLDRMLKARDALIWSSGGGWGPPHPLKPKGRDMPAKEADAVTQRKNDPEQRR